MDGRALGDQVDSCSLGDFMIPGVGEAVGSSPARANDRSHMALSKRSDRVNNLFSSESLLIEWNSPPQQHTWETAVSRAGVQPSSKPLITGRAEKCV